MSERPISGASPAELASQLRQARTRTHRLTDELSSEQLMGLKLDIVNPVLWEIGHVGWSRSRADRRRRPYHRRRAC